MGFMMYLFGALFLLMGLLRLFGKTVLLKGEYQKKLEQKEAGEKKSFLKWNGILTLVVGVVFVLAGILGDHWEETWYWVAFLVPVGICFLGLAYLNSRHF